MEIALNTGELYKIGKSEIKDKEYEFDIPAGYKVISFGGVLEATTESRLLNLQLMINDIEGDCEGAEETISYRDHVKDYYKSFDITKT
jgi:hypothetical protein